jgi:hypothetical protein
LERECESNGIAGFRGFRIRGDSENRAISDIGR